MFKKTLLALSLATLFATTSCEEADENKFDKNPAEGHAVVFGDWYKKGYGGPYPKIQWYWAHIYLEQDGTKVSGSERFEGYTAHKVEGHVDGNKLYLNALDKKGDKIIFTLDAVVENESMKVYQTRVDDAGGQIETGERSFFGDYKRISEEIPEQYW